MSIQLRTDYQRTSQPKLHVEPEAADIRDQVMLLWKAKWFIAAMTLGFGILAMGVAFLTPRQYEATVMLSPVSNTGSGGQLGALSSMASQFGGLASLAGISMGGDTGKAESIAVLQSESLTESYIQQKGLLQVIFKDKWDAAKNDWITHDPKIMPTLWKGYRKFDKSIRKVVTNPKNGLVTLTITWTDPKLAAAWANDLVRMANDELRDKAIRMSERNIDYLNAEAAKSNVVEVKQAIFSLMKTEINRAMIARGSDEYAFKVIDPAISPEMASSPVKTLWTLAGLAGGFMLSVFALLTRAAWKRDPIPTRQIG